MEDFIEMARCHRKTHLPDLYRRLQAEGRLEEHLVSVARMAEEEVLELTSEQGMNLYEAMEIVLSKYILVSPESAKSEALES